MCFPLKTFYPKFDKAYELNLDLKQINLEFMYLFSYSVGYSLLLDGRTCVDVDECHENTRICNGGKCVNTPGSYMCHCTDGLIPGPGGISCLGIHKPNYRFSNLTYIYVNTIVLRIMNAKFHRRCVCIKTLFIVFRC